MRESVSKGTKRWIGVATLLGAVALVVVTFHPPAMPWSRPFTFKVAAANFGELNKAAGVELGGVKVGTVDSVVQEGSAAQILVSVDPAYRSRFHSDASVTIRPHGLLGPKYLDVDGGTTGLLPEGGVIPSSRVHVTQDVDQVLYALQPDVRESLKTFLVELSVASDGRGGDVNTALTTLGTAHAQLRQTADTLKTSDQDLGDFFVYSEQLNRDLQNAPIDQQIADTDLVLQGLVAVEQDFGTGIDRTADVLRQLAVVMDGNDGANGNLAQVLARSPALVNRLRAVVAEGDTIVVGVNPSLPSLMTAVVETKSAFSYADANGHYVRVMALSGQCSAGAPGAGTCATPDGRVGAPVSHSNPSGGGTTGSSQPAGATDQQLINLLVGGS